MEQTFKLDTAAELFPAVTRKTNTSTYRISAYLKEEVDAAALQQAADKTLKRFPTFAVRLGKDAFGQWLEPCDAPFAVREETGYPCGLIEPEKNNGYLFTILYFGRRVCIEVFHALADGAGAVEFLKTLLYQYLTLKGNAIDPQGKVLLPEEPSSPEEQEDSLLRYYRQGVTGKKHEKQPVAFKIKGTLFEPYGNNVVQGVLPVEELKLAAKRNGATITGYLAAVMIYAIYREAVRDQIDEEPIVLSVPVNLRGLFPSKTLRNFFCIVNVTMPVTEHLTFERIVRDVMRQLREKTQKEALEAAMAESCGTMQHPVVRSVPRFMRDAGTRFVFAFMSENVKTMTLSNVGEIELPDDMRPFVDRMEAIIYPTERSPINCCMCSVNGRMTISFIRSIREAGVLKAFFGMLAREVDSEIEIDTNSWGVCDETL